MEAAHLYGLTHLAITDRDGVYGLPQGHRAAVECGLPLLCGATLTVEGGGTLAMLAQSIEGWHRLCGLITEGRRESQKGFCEIPMASLLEKAKDLSCIVLPGWSREALGPVVDAFGEQLDFALTRSLGPHDAWAVQEAVNHSTHFARPMVATNDVLYHAPERQHLADVLTCIRRKTTLSQAGRALHCNDQRYLLPPEVFLERYGDFPNAIKRTIEIAERCEFRLSELSYRYPPEVVPEGYSAMGWLREIVERELPVRYPEGVPPKVQMQLTHELGLIDDLDFASYFLTVYDIVRFARSRHILCQGRGSAANSAVCYVLGITAVDPATSSLLFERFLSKERGEPPDIDVDFEHERREEVIQYIYTRYGRHRAAMVNEVISYRSRSALRQVGKVFELSVEQIERLLPLVGRDGPGLRTDLTPHLIQLGFDPDSPAIRWTIRMARELVGFPRHLSIHVGGFVIAENSMDALVPVEPATREGRTVIQWDKYGVEALGFVKVDILALGILTAIRKSFDLIREHYDRPLSLHTLPREDPGVYRMFQQADTVGVFQIESRAQQSMLPRLKPRCFYDLVVEVAIVRPGPIQGGMVHPYLRRRMGQEPVTYAHPLLEPILERTLGVPLFQEQVMAMAVTVGGFSPGEADELRRAMGAWRKRGTLGALGERLVAGMIERGISTEYAAAVLEQIKGFGEYGFPESHAASFAHLVYASGWIKHHYPEVFCAALINSQPMGFYAPRSLVGDARRHGVEAFPVDVQRSQWDCTLEEVQGQSQRGIRLGLRLIKGVSEDRMKRLAENAPYRDLADFVARSGVNRQDRRVLSDAGALRSLEPDRRQAAWVLGSTIHDLPLFAAVPQTPKRVSLPKITPAESLVSDYRTLGLSLEDHPAAMVRRTLMARMGKDLVPLSQLSQLPTDTEVEIVGLVSSRQRPGTARGITFLGLEDESGIANVVVWPKVWKAHRQLFVSHPVIGVRGRLQRHDEALSVLVIQPWSVQEADAHRAANSVRSRNFH